ncbi:MAG: phage late control D family protein [Treponema sp.]|jgi:hypothetical protein|nr:phage late control D family protein [Treponema sp.]
MPGDSKKVMLSLRFGGGGFTDLYPYELELKEGFSRVFRGKLTALTGTLHTGGELAELLDAKVSLSVSQRLGEGQISRTRWVHGIVSAVEYSGLITGGSRQDCYCYTLIIESELARLRHTLFTESFYRVNPVDIAESLLERYGIAGRFAGEYIDRRKYSRHLMYEQVNTSVLDFLHQVLLLYGLSYTCRHPRAEGARLGEGELYFSDGERYPVSDVVYSDNRKVPDVRRFDFLGKDEGQSLWRMDKWRMENSIGVEGLKLSASYPESARRNHEWRRGEEKNGRYYNIAHQFHAYERQTPETEIDDDLKLILDASYLGMRLARSRWEGEAENLALVPGLVFELARLYGRRDNSILTAMVTETDLRARTVWPPNLAVNPESAGDGELVGVKASCMDFGKDSPKRFVAGY